MVARSLLALLLALPAAAAGREASSLAAAAGPVVPDWELAQDAVERGEILPLSDILAVAQATPPGDLVAIEIEDGLLDYEEEVLTPKGRLLEVDLDAATGAIVDVDEEDLHGEDADQGDAADVTAGPGAK